SEQAEAEQARHRTGPAKQQQTAVDQPREHHDVEPVRPRRGGERAVVVALEQPAHAPPTARKTVSAWRVAATSCTRMTCAPRAAAASAAPTEPWTRSAGSLTPVSAPTKALREAPIRTR